MSRKGPEYDLVETQDEADVIDISDEEKAKFSADDISAISSTVSEKVTSVGDSVSSGVNVSCFCDLSEV